MPLSIASDGPAVDVEMGVENGRALALLATHGEILSKRYSDSQVQIEQAGEALLPADKGRENVVADVVFVVVVLGHIVLISTQVTSKSGVPVTATFVTVRDDGVIPAVVNIASIRA